MIVSLSVANSAYFSLPAILLLSPSENEYTTSQQEDSLPNSTCTKICAADALHTTTPIQVDKALSCISNKQVPHAHSGMSAVKI